MISMSPHHISFDGSTILSDLLEMKGACFIKIFPVTNQILPLICLMSSEKKSPKQIYGLNACNMESNTFHGRSSHSVLFEKDVSHY